jgi:hypothetical protein
MDPATRDYLGHLGEPPTVAPVRADLFGGPLFGRRVVLDTQDGHVRDMRAVSELDAPAGLSPSVRIIHEAAYYRWRDLPTHCRSDWPRGCVAWPATMVYVER